MNRSHTITFSGICLLGLAVLQVGAESASIDLPAVKANISIANCLSFLASQQRADGSFESRGTKLSSTALSLMAFLADGHTAEGGKYGGVVRRAVDFLLRQTPGDRYFGRVDGSKMYGQAVVTLALCQAYGVEPDEQTRARLRATLKDAANFLVTSQNARNSRERGGWSEDHGGAGSNPIVTQWVMDALKASEAIGLKIPKETFDRSEEYLSRWKKEKSPTSISSVRSGDERYFESRELDDASWNAAINSLIAQQKPDGGWSEEESTNAAESISATSLAELCISQKLRLAPAAD